MITQNWQKQHYEDCDELSNLLLNAAEDVHLQDGTMVEHALEKMMQGTFEEMINLIDQYLKAFKGNGTLKVKMDFVQLSAID